jgi:anaerobic C4-dicarboxylate transporter
MKDSIFKYGLVAVVLYFGINWVADNPRLVNQARHHVNTCVKNGKQAISDSVN